MSRRRLYTPGENRTIERARQLISLIDEDPRATFTAATLARKSGLAVQETAVVLASLEVIRQTVRRYDAAKRQEVWSAAQGDAAPTALAKSAIETFYTVAEAAAVAGRTEKAIRRRIERGTLTVIHERRRVLVTHGALRAAGLIDGRRKWTKTSAGAQATVDVLRHRPRTAYSTWQLSDRVRLPRQTMEVILAALTAAGVVERRFRGGYEWFWTGDGTFPRFHAPS